MNTLSFSSIRRLGGAMFAMFILALAGAAKASEPLHILIKDVVTFDANDNPIGVVWSSSGAFTSSGTVTLQRQLEYHGGPVAVEHVIATHMDAQGSFAVEAEHVLGLGHPGYWVIRDGTGIYAGLHGSGTLTIHSIDAHNLLVVQEGEVHFD